MGNSGSDAERPPEGRSVEGSFRAGGRGGNMRYEWINDFLMNKRAVTKDLQESWNWIRYHIGGKMFAAVLLQTEQNGLYFHINYKGCDEEEYTMPLNREIIGFCKLSAHTICSSLSLLRTAPDSYRQTQKSPLPTFVSKGRMGAVPPSLVHQKIIYPFVSHISSPSSVLPA